MLSQALGGLRVVAEQYPELRATENFQQLSRNLCELEDEIQASRRIYNSNVQAYNTKIQVFPNSVIANSGGFTAREFFEIEDPGDREVPTFSFGDAAPAAAPAPPAASPPPPAPRPRAAPPAAATTRSIDDREAGWSKGVRRRSRAPTTSRRPLIAASSAHDGSRTSTTRWPCASSSSAAGADEHVLVAALFHDAVENSELTVGGRERRASGPRSASWSRR